jgi:hypothetical protein
MPMLEGHPKWPSEADFFVYLANNASLVRDDGGTFFFLQVVDFEFHHFRSEPHILLGAR